MTTTERSAALEALPAHIKSWNDPQYIPHPTTWLNGKRWEDEVQTAKKDAPIFRNGIYIAPGVDL